MTALDLNKRLKQIKLQRMLHTCAPISELPSIIDTMELWEISGSKLQISGSATNTFYHYSFPSIIIWLAYYRQQIYMKEILNAWRIIFDFIAIISFMNKRFFVPPKYVRFSYNNICIKEKSNLKSKSNIFFSPDL